MRHIKYTQLAILDLNNSYDYLYVRNPVAAKTIIDRIELTILKIAENPCIGHKGRVQNTFEIVVLNTPFIIVYIISDDTLNIISILHTSRKFP